jgi:hypothetical protein
MSIWSGVNPIFYDAADVLLKFVPMKKALPVRQSG